MDWDGLSRRIWPMSVNDSGALDATPRRNAFLVIAAAGLVFAALAMAHALGVAAAVAGFAIIAASAIFSIRTGKENPESGHSAALPVGLRDVAVLATLIYTAARAGAVARLRIRDLSHDGTQYLLRFQEKGGKSREIPVRHDLQGCILNYLAAAGLADAHRDSPLFRSADRRTGKLTAAATTGQDICRMVKRRLKDAGLPTQYSPHSFRVATITDLLLQGAALEDVQYLAGHSDPRVTRLYDRRHKQVTRKIVDKISI